MSTIFSRLSVYIFFYFFLLLRSPHSLSFFFFNDTATTEIYTLSLHDALPILLCWPRSAYKASGWRIRPWAKDRKSTRLNSSHLVISYAVFCLKKKKTNKNQPYTDRYNWKYAEMRH